MNSLESFRKELYEDLHPVMDCIEVMMRKGVHLVTVRFSNKDFLKPSQQRDDYFISLLNAAKSRHDLNPIVKVSP